jgi:sugar phosphate isomerase/epimerase
VSAARELARATAAAPLVQCECVRVHAGAGWPLNRPPTADWANRPSQYIRGAFALVERIGISNQYEGRQSWTDDGMHEMSVRLDDGTDLREASQRPRYIWILSVPTIRPASGEASIFL